MNQNKQRAFVFIDGNNFYFKLKELSSRVDGKFKLLDFNFRGFAEWLVIPNQLIEIHYYVGALKRQRNEKSEKMYADQQKLIGKLQQQKIAITLGQLIQHPDKTFHEKGVDVRLAVEMIRFARQDKYDIAYLISSDTDLVAAVEETQSFNKRVQYVGVAKGQSFGLTKVADDVRLLRPEDIKTFLPQSLF
ncbi:MAG: NYN domain-containing protein [Candidatus Liptonbacteria bacterium]|nr:NYN domain-containing protein [Candidatus Liptonbacteria bacterium]